MTRVGACSGGKESAIECSKEKGGRWDTGISQAIRTCPIDTVKEGRSGGTS